MQGTQLLQLIKELDERFRPALSAKKSFERGMDVVWAELEQIHEGAFEPALRKLKTATNTMPTIDRVLAVFQVEGKKAMLADSDHRQDEWDKTKGYGDPRYRSKGKPEEIELTAVQLKARDEHARFAIMGFCMMDRRDKTPAEKLEFFKTMADRYPHLDWGKEGVNQQKWYEQQKNKPHWRPIEEAPIQFQLRWAAEHEGHTSE